MSYTKASLNAVLEQEAPKVQAYLAKMSLPVSSENVKKYHEQNGDRKGPNAIKKMVQHLSK